MTRWSRRQRQKQFQNQKLECKSKGTIKGPKGKRGKKGYWAKVPRNGKGKKTGQKGSLNALEEAPNTTSGAPADKNASGEVGEFDEVWVEVPDDEMAWQGAENGWYV